MTKKNLGGYSKWYWLKIFSEKKCYEQNISLCLSSNVFYRFRIDLTKNLLLYSFVQRGRLEMSNQMTSHWRTDVESTLIQIHQAYYFR